MVGSLSVLLQIIHLAKYHKLGSQVNYAPTQTRQINKIFYKKTDRVLFQKQPVPDSLLTCIVMMNNA